MARVTIRVKYPKNSGEKLLVLFEQIIEKHKKLGDESPLHDLNWLDMSTFEALVKNAKKNRDESFDFRAESVALMQGANNIIGIGKGQTSRTEGTLYFMMTAIIDLLLGYHKGQEKALQEYGFHVVIRKVRLPKRKKKKESGKE